MDIRFYTNFLVSYLYNTNRINEDDRYRLQMTLMKFLSKMLAQRLQRQTRVSLELKKQLENNK